MVRTNLLSSHPTVEADFSPFAVRDDRLDAAAQTSLLNSGGWKRCKMPQLDGCAASKEFCAPRNVSAAIHSVTIAADWRASGSSLACLAIAHARLDKSPPDNPLKLIGPRLIKIFVTRSVMKQRSESRSSVTAQAMEHKS